MDAQHTAQNHGSPTSPNLPQPLPRSSSYSGVRNDHRLHGRSGPLRRGHSDGDSAFTRPSITQENAALYPPGINTTRPSSRDADTVSSRMATGMQDVSPSRDHILRDHRDRERAALLITDRINRTPRPQGDYLRRLPFTNTNIEPAGQRMSHVGRGDSSFIGRSTPGHSYSLSNPLPPRDLNRQLPRRPSGETSQLPIMMDLQPPRWQPDAEASECPICHNGFSFWYRKHHCRKCGRVVCANCSPHRITIPRQFIVHPPDDASASLSTTAGIEPGIEDVDEDDQNAAVIGSNATGPGSPVNASRPGLGGGQEVRLCNPCVPDPNPLPPPPYPSHNHREVASRLWPERGSSHHAHRSRERSIGPPYNVPSSLLNDASPGTTLHESNTAAGFNDGRPQMSSTSTSNNDELSFIHSRPVRHIDLAYAYPNRATAYGSAPDQVGDERYHHLDSLRRHHQHQRQGRQSGHRHHTSLNHLSGDRTSLGRLLGDSEPRPVRQPQLKEEDECPICHNGLPPKGADGSETARETHVEACIATHFSSSTPRTVVPHPSMATQAAIVANSATPSQAQGGRATHAESSVSDNSHDSQLPSSLRRRRTVGMVVYPATEKDCVQEDGESGAECVICFEEFAVGDEMGRLECLCKFHRHCIRQWWETKGPGSCPVHQQPEAG